jgi:hypothetical protein
VPGSDLADRAAALLSLAAATQERSLSQLTTLAASQVPGCAAASVTIWHDGDLARQAASHPDASRLVAVQVDSGRGPLIDAVTSGGAVSCADTLTETSWPEFAAAAVRLGVRSAVTLSHTGRVFSKPTSSSWPSCWWPTAGRWSVPFPTMTTRAG